MRVNASMFMLMSGFKSLEWPLSQSIKDVLNRFALSNDLFVSAVNATIWHDNVYENEAQYIQVTFFEDENCVHTLSTTFVYPIVQKSVDKFDPVQLNWIDSNNYAYSIEDYFKMCSQSTSFFTRASHDMASGCVLKTIDNADNALIELEMLSAVN